jgi:hypothetical protein
MILVNKNEFLYFFCMSGPTLYHRKMFAIPKLKRAYRIRSIAKSEDIDPFDKHQPLIKDNKSDTSHSDSAVRSWWKKIGRGWVSTLL